MTRYVIMSANAPWIIEYSVLDCALDMYIIMHTDVGSCLTVQCSVYYIFKLT